MQSPPGGPSPPNRPPDELVVPSRYRATVDLSGDRWTVKQRLWLTVPRQLATADKLRLRMLLRQRAGVRREVRGQGWRVATRDTHGLPLVRSDREPARQRDRLHLLAANRLPLSDVVLRVLPGGVVVRFVPRAGSRVTITAPRHALHHLDPPAPANDIPNGRTRFRLALPDDGTGAVAVDVAHGLGRTGLYAAVQGNLWTIAAALALAVFAAWAGAWFSARRSTQRTSSAPGGGSTS